MKMKTKSVAVAAVISLILSFVGFVAAFPAYASTLEFETLPQIPDSTIQTMATDPEILAYAERIQPAVMGNTIMLENINNVAKACMNKLITMDKVGIAACADFVDAQNKAFSTFLKDNQNLTTIILYGS